MDLYRFVLTHCPEIVASSGLVMDIIGIWLLFWYGGIAGRRLENRDFVDVLADDDHPLRRARSRAWTGASCGLGLAVAGFVLQIVAQWLH